MAWPTDDLTTTHLDAGTDDPSQARAELKSAVDKLKSVLGEVTAAATVWHSGNDGGGSGLDADTVDTYQASALLDLANATGTLSSSKVQTTGLDADTLDGQHGSYYQNATNLTSGTLSMDRIGADAITAAKIAANAVGNSELASAAVKQGNLSTTDEENSTTSNDVTHFTTSAGKYSFYMQIKVSSSNHFDMYGGHMGLDNSWNKTVTTTYTTWLNLQSASARTIYGNVTYINSSPPFNLGDGDIPLFVWALLDSSSNIISVQTSEVPPWAYNGPTDIMHDRTDKTTGRKYKTVYEIDEDSGLLLNSEIEITQDLKNRDMPLIPHPFASKTSDQTVVLLDPVETGYLFDVKKGGQSVNELLHNDYLRLDNTPLSRAAPQGVTPTRFKWKNTQRKAGEMIRDRRLNQGPYAPEIPAPAGGD